MTTKTKKHNNSALARVYHPWTSWECFRSGFYNTVPPVGMTSEQAKEKYRDFLRDLKQFESGILRVFDEWPNSCEHFLTNHSMNRIAWIGQAAMCISTGISNSFRGGFKLLTIEEQNAANQLAEQFLQEWIAKRCVQKKTSKSI